MAIEPRLPTALSHDPDESLTLEQKEALRRGVAKMVELGAQVGVSVDRMMELLQSGLTVRELLEYLAMRAGEMS